MLSKPAVIEASAAGLARHGRTKIVLRPGDGGRVQGQALPNKPSRPAAQRAPARALVVTPNLPEAAALLGEAMAEDEDAMRAQAERILALGPKAVLIKGGHASGPESVDLLVEERGVTRLSAARVKTRNSHGTGCTLSSAIAAELAKGASLADAVRTAKAWLSAAIAAADTLEIGSGHGPVHHFHGIW